MDCSYLQTSCRDIKSLQGVRCVGVCLENIPPENVDVELLPRIVVVAVPPTPIELIAASPKEIVEVAVVEVAENVRKAGFTLSTSLNSWLSEAEVIISEVFCPA